MAHERPDLGPAAVDARRWGTGGTELTIFCLVRTLVSAIRLAEILWVFDGDPRVELVWVVCPGSRFEYGVLDWFSHSGVSWISLETAKQGRCDLVVTTSEWIDLSAFGDTPVILVPHGLGFHKYVTDPDTNLRRLSGLARPDGLRRGHVTQVVTHPDQEVQLARATEEIVGRTALGGDSSYDLLVNSRGERQTYRAALGVEDHQRLITVGSTWGQGSLFSQRFELITQLLAELPHEQYRVALFVHPAAWSFDAENIPRWLRRHIDFGGLMLIDPAKGWHATLLASDLLIGDNGSTTLYGALLDIPLLLATFSEDVVPGTVMAQLGREARAVDPNSDLRWQIEDELVNHDPTRAGRLTERTIARPGQSDELFRALSYDKGRLPMPDDELPVLAAPLPTPETKPVRSFRFNSHVDKDSAVVVDTYPAAFRAAAHHPGERQLVELGEPNLRRYYDAAIIVDPKPVAAPAAECHLAKLIDKYTGCRVAMVSCDDGSYELLVRDGRRLRVTTGDGIPARVLACACYQLLLAQRELSGEVVVRTSTGEAKMAVVLL
ncbi:hypothetical protein GCM10011609_63990 [Lentzea pudingi]|uniref:CDP-Glycerol:Poly(Glycerophosphate) glycerophosphotransferase n=1 Tax=Lentzea pudingi TaxID=1789439 RepID=A0ABQ2IJR4_9PSEU|nr:hypothetical protein [Lentzea pudingi]GGN14611.1 hypothetical protein GCM10011609_63990 [Lentzea pudingi]